jgi:WD40 repeat protein
VWDAGSGKPVKLFKVDGGVQRARFSPDGTRVLALEGRSDAGTFVGRAASLWDVEKHTLLMQLLQDDRPILDISFGPDGRQLVTAGQDGRAGV